MDRRYGTTTSQGYGARHQQLREAWASHVATGTVHCARCDRPIKRGAPWDLGHKDGTGKREYSGPEHRSCNRRAGAVLRNAQASDPAPRPLTEW